LDSFRTGFLMLGLLFVYDVFWVFKTDVMVTVARAFDVPVKLLMPRHVADYFVARPTQASLLGLGDIVIPGIFLALARRFDAHQSKADSAKKEHDGGKFQYFSFAMAAYILGLACTVLVMHFWQAAQPALLYLSPACSLAVVLCALLNGELQAMWSYTTEASDDDDAVKRKQRKPAAKKGVAKRQPGYKGEESGADDDDDDGNNDDDGQEMEAAKTTGKRRPVRSAAKAD
jgi:minor histocompatibility antigen H13